MKCHDFSLLEISLRDFRPSIVMMGAMVDLAEAAAALPAAAETAALAETMAETAGHSVRMSGS